MKKLISIIMALCITVGLTGCIDRLSDEHLALQVMAVSSIPGTLSTRQNQILLLDTDSYGRQLFAYYSNGYPENILSLCISQKVTEKSVYYYDNINYIICMPKWDGQGRLGIKFVNANFTEEAIADLKNKNDWGKATDEEKYFSVEVTWAKTKFISQRKADKALESLGIKVDSAWSEHLVTDKNGKSIFCISFQEHDSTIREILAVYDWWGNFVGEGGAVEIDDPANFGEEIIALKEVNDWCSFPYAKK